MKKADKGHLPSHNWKRLNSMWGGSAWVSQRRVIVILIALVVVVSCAAVTNGQGLKQAIDTRTRDYVGDVSFQLAQDIDYRLVKISQDLEVLADSIIQLDGVDEQLKFLKRKAPLMGFTELFLVDINGNAWYTDGTTGSIADEEAYVRAAAGESGISLLGGQSILYAQPMVFDGQVRGILAGIRDKENMQRLVQLDSFDGQGLSCLIDTAGNVIISPTKLESYLVLDDLFVEGEDPELVRDIERMQRDLRENRSGTIFFTTPTSDRVVMCYTPLASYDWVLLTLTDAGILSAEVDRYNLRNGVITAATIVLFLATIVIILYIQRSGSRQLLHVAYVDPITGGMNNPRFQMECRSLVQKAPAGSYTLVSLNLRNFKLVNENFGITMGNKTLRHILNTLEKDIAENELAARGESDNFYLCLYENKPDDVRRRLEEMEKDINAFNIGSDRPYHLSLTQGAYIISDPDLDVTVMQDRANTARKSGVAGQGCNFYSAEDTERLRREKELTDLMEGSLKNGDFKVYLQPKVRLCDGKTAGAEALVRWQHPQRGTIFPSDFIPLFERSGAIKQVDFCIFEQVCALQRRWADEGRSVIPISINLSRQHFQVPDFLQRFKEISDRYSIPPGWIELELTESIFFTDGDINLVKDLIGEMHRMGFACSLDDFGSGYSSLGLLKEFDVDAIKLDRSFFVSLPQRRAEDVVEAITGLAQKLHVQTVAEGIETDVQLEVLRRAGCDLVQGYYFSKPLPVADFEIWRAARDASV